MPQELYYLAAVEYSFPVAIFIMMLMIYSIEPLYRVFARPLIINCRAMAIISLITITFLLQAIVVEPKADFITYTFGVIFLLISFFEGVILNQLVKETNP